MNPLPPNADELVSAYLDGQAAPDEVAMVESSPELMERVEALRGISALLGAPIEAPADQKEAHISAALDAFDAMFTEAPADPATPQLTAAAEVATPAVTATAPPATSDKESGVVSSLSEARERRRPRRFNTGIIAASVAAVLLFVAIAAFGFGGGGGDDVATSAAEASFDMDTDASDAVDTYEVAMDDESASALNELQSAAPAPTAGAGTARVDSAEAMADDAMDDEEAMDEEAMDEEAMEDEAEEEAADFDSAGDASDQGSAAESAAETDQLFSFAELRFEDQASLLAELEVLTIDELDQQARLVDQGLFPGCQAEIEELAKAGSPTLVGLTFVDDEPVEIHRIVDETGELAFVIVDAGCMIVPAAS